MFCMSCGAQNADTAQFCAKCGKPLAASKPVAAAASAPQPQPQQAASAQPQPQAQQQYQQPNYGRPQQPQQQYAPQAGAYQAPVRVEGCMGAAWHDITSSPNWFKRVLTLCLVAVVPILNFAVDGYCLRWARELSFGKRESLPDRIFRKHEFATGFFAFLISFSLTCAYGIVLVAGICLISGLFAMLNIVLGIVILTILILAAVVFTLLFFMPAVDACVVRMAVTGYLESGFNVKLVWGCFRRSMGSLMAASLLPNIIVGIVKGIIVVILYAIIGAIGYGGATSAMSSMGRYMNPMYMMYGSGYGSLQSAVSMVSGVVLIVVFMLLLIYVVNAMFDMFANLFTYRAVGHWVARTAPEWAQESGEGKLDALVEDTSALQAETVIGTGFATDYSKPIQ